MYSLSTGLGDHIRVNMADDTVLILENVKYKKKEGSLILTKSRLAWNAEDATELAIDVPYVGIKSMLNYNSIAWRILSRILFTRTYEPIYQGCHNLSDPSPINIMG